MSSPRNPAPPKDHGQLGNGERGRAHWPLDLELHPEKEEELFEPEDLNDNDEDED